MNLINPRGINMTFVDIVAQIISIISAIKLHEGGAAMLAEHIINHIIDIVGIIMFTPLFIIMLREFDIE